MGIDLAIQEYIDRVMPEPICAGRVTCVGYVSKQFGNEIFYFGYLIVRHATDTCL